MQEVDYQNRTIRWGENLRDFGLDVRADRDLRFWCYAASAECANAFFQARIFEHVGSRAVVTVEAVLGAFDETIDRLRVWPQPALQALEDTLLLLRNQVEKGRKAA